MKPSIDINGNEIKADMIIINTITKNHLYIDGHILEYVIQGMDCTHLKIVYTKPTKEQILEISKPENSDEVKKYVPVGRQYKNINALKNAIQRKEEALTTEQRKNTEKFSRIGFGSNMRGYKNVSQMSFTKETRLKDQLANLIEQLDHLEFKKVA